MEHTDNPVGGVLTVKLRISTSTGSLTILGINLLGMITRGLGQCFPGASIACTQIRQVERGTVS